MTKTTEASESLPCPSPGERHTSDGDNPAAIDQSRKQTDASLGLERTTADELLRSEYDAADRARKDFRASSAKVIANVRERNEKCLAKHPEDPHELTRLLHSERHVEDQLRDAERSFRDQERHQELEERTNEENATVEQRKATDKDLTLERVAEDRVRGLSEEPFHLLVSQVKDYAIFLLDPQGNIISWNEGAEHLKGYKAAEIIGKHFSIFYPQRDLDLGIPEKELRLALQDGRVEAEGWRVRKDGSTFMANVLITALHGPSREHRGFAKITQDVTQRFTRAERDLLRSEESLRFATEHVAAVVALHVNAEKALSRHQRLVESVTAQIGKPRTIIALIAVSSMWILANIAAPLVGMTPWDPLPCFWLQGAVGAYAGLVATMVLATQNRQQRQAEQQAYLHLQVNLAAEKKTAKVIELMEELRRDLPSVPSRVDHQATAMACAVDPHALLTVFNEMLNTTKVKE